MPSVDGSRSPTVRMSHPERLRSRARDQNAQFRQTGGQIDLRQFVVAQFLAVLIAELASAILLE